MAASNPRSDTKDLYLYHLGWGIFLRIQFRENCGDCKEEVSVHIILLVQEAAVCRCSSK